jgi:Kef-type K+ transport system membrane component KefB
VAHASLFGASIAFEIPILLFDNGIVLAGESNGLGLATFAIMGFSMMAGEAEFAFLVAGFGLSEGLFSQEVYASVVFAILLSTIVSPVLLRTTLALCPNKESINDTAINVSEIHSRIGIVTMRG